MAQFERLGLEPLDSARSYRQRIPLTRVVIDREAAALEWSRDDTRGVIAGDHFHHFAGDSTAFLPFEGPVTAEAEYRRDLGGVTGRVVVLGGTGGVPLDSIALALELAGARALIVSAPDSARYVALRHARGRWRYFVGARTGSPSDRRLPVLITHPSIVSSLGRASTVRLRVGVRYEPVIAWNMMARRRGTVSATDDRPVIFSAHYDHIGYSEAVGGDSLYNGFMDNAAGVGAVLGIAEAMRTRPLRMSAIYLLTAVEEEGSFGAAYFVSHPPVPLGGLTAVINLDAGAPLASPLDWYVEGGAHPVIAAAVRRLARNGVKVRVTPLNRSSDHWPFHLRGVPAAFPVQGDAWAGMREADIERATARWWRQHRPQDEWHPDFPLSGLRSYASFALALGRALALDSGPRP